MLLNWQIRDFKSFKGHNEFPLAPITILCGANSSGKSSVIQSMLLIKQTLQHSAAGRAIALNGPLVRLGSFSDIENFSSKQTATHHSLGLGWHLSRPTDENQPNNLLVSGLESIDDLKVSFSIDVSGAKQDREALELQPNLTGVQTSGHFFDSEGNDHNFSINVCRSSGKGRKFNYSKSSLEGVSDPFAYTVRDLDDETKARATEGYPKGKIVGCQLRYFMPSALFVRFDRGKLTAQQLYNAISVGRASRRLYSLEIPAIVANILRDIAKEIASPLLPIDHSPLGNADHPLVISDYTAAISGFNPGYRRRFLSAVDENKVRIERALLNYCGSELLITASRLDTLRESWQMNDAFFRFSLHYVGPLRDEPRPLYALQALSSPTDVGPKGELTAAVLHLNERRPITYVAASSFAEDEVREVVKTGTLREALLDWLIYLGIAFDFQTSEKGKFGHELRIKTDDGMEFQDLTNVGVGVSQVLPILVSCFLATRGSTIVLEQPELHLHPGTQARLADFFIAMGMLGKQCIIETHGEHIIERFRLRVVSDMDDSIREMTRIYFFKKRFGNTVLKSVELTKFGAIVDWPEDFFDQSQKETERIMSKALERRRIESAKRGRTV